MVFGTFDGLHQGHLNFFKQARGSGQRSFLIVSVARDRNVRKIKKRRPFLNEKKRMALIRKSRLADRVVLSGIGNHMPHIIKERPDIIALGYDQKGIYTKNLKNNLKKEGLWVKIIRLKPYRHKIFKSHLLKSKTSL